MCGIAADIGSSPVFDLNQDRATVRTVVRACRMDNCSFCHTADILADAGIDKTLEAGPELLVVWMAMTVETRGVCLNRQTPRSCHLVVVLESGREGIIELVYRASCGSSLTSH